MATNFYNDFFYNYQFDGSYLSAREMAPLVYEAFKPKSIIDFGCGLGSWLIAFKELCKIEDIRGVDGDYVKPDKLRISQDHFVSYDLTKFYDAGRKFDLAISMEVGEHLPESAADEFVKSLVHASSKVLFSAALPGQGGTFHMNEQFPEYWAEKFDKHGFVAVDYFRKKIWHNENIWWFYRQNMLIFIHKDVLPNYPQLQEAYLQTDQTFLSRIHPELLKAKELDIERLKNPLKNIRYHLYMAKQQLKGS